MSSRSLLVILLAFVFTISPLAATFSGSVYAEEGAADEQELMTEGQLSTILVNVLGLAPLLPPNPQQIDRIAILMQNNISPKDGWNATNYVTMATLARVLVQSMGDESEIENPEDDASWVNYLSSIGIEFGTINEGLDQVPTIIDPVAVVAVEPSTDPLRKVPSIRPSDEQQLGADLQPFTTQLTGEDIIRIITEAQPPVIPAPEPTTPS